MDLKKLLPQLLLLLSLGTMAQEKYTISGSLRDADNGEDLIGATVLVVGQPGVGTTSNVYGFYSLTLPKGEYTLAYSYIGFETINRKINLDQNLKIDLELSGALTTLEMVEVSAEKKDENITSTEMSVQRIDLKEIESVPVLFGERDILKTIQLYPGVKTAGEGNAGFYVRGGAADQNLILLDEAPVYNASHLLGFFSVFNSDALKDVKLYKGGMPAEYGGRLSSVMDIKMKEGNSKKMAVSGGIGLISSKLTVEAPIVKDKGSFIVSGRRTYADLFLKLSRRSNLRDSRLYFYDVNAKANYRLGKNDRIFASGYFGRDVLGFSDNFGFDWGNTTGTLRWNHIYNDKLFSNTSFIYSNYNYEIEFKSGNTIAISSSIRDLNLKQDFDYFINNENTLKFGGNVIRHRFDPGKIQGEGSDFKIEKRHSYESSAYVSNTQTLTSKLSATYGLRFSNFTQLGPGKINDYDDDGNLSKVINYKSGEVVASYNNLAPRASLTYLLDESSSLKGSYARTVQYLHLISNSTSTNPTDIWLPSSNNIKPGLADQVALGYFRNLNDNAYEFSVETYYKAMQNSIDYRDGAEVTLNPSVEGELLFGKGRAYGLELLLKKKEGNFTGWVSYTLSRSERKFDDINDGSWFAAKQDRTHDISAVGMYSFSDRLKVSASWVYYTGNAVTFPSGKYVIEDEVYSLYSERNGERMPDYHRLDLGVTLTNRPFKTKVDPVTGEQVQIPRRFESSWNFSVYNAYSRSNAYSITFRTNEDDPTRNEAVRTTLFRIIPAISYNFKF